MLDQNYLQFIMIKSKSLLNGIGNYKKTNAYYDEWSAEYDKTLLKWNYSAPKKSSAIIKTYVKSKPKNILDLACGTGLFAEKIIKIFPKSIIDGLDISKKILNEAKFKNIYNNLQCKNFDKKLSFKKKYDLVSCIGALTYTKNPFKLFLNILKITSSGGYFIFTHRVDLWKKQNYSHLLNKISNKWSLVFISRPRLYLPKNSDFTDKIKIKIVLLKKR